MTKGQPVFRFLQENLVLANIPFIQHSIKKFDNNYTQQYCQLEWSFKLFDKTVNKRDILKLIIL